MHLQLPVIAALANLISPSISNPLPPHPLSARGPITAGIWVCTKPDFKGDCSWARIAADGYGKCLPINRKDGFGSIGPDQTVSLHLYKDDKCANDLLPKQAVVWPGTLTSTVHWPQEKIFFIASTIPLPKGVPAPKYTTEDGSISVSIPQ
jgi:hypothetical protein